MPHEAKKARYRALTFVLLAVVCVAAIIFVWNLFNIRNQDALTEPTETGQLIQPPLVFSQLKLTDANDKLEDIQKYNGHWLMVYIAPLPCQQQCQDNLYKIRQVWVALGKNMDKVQRMLVTYKGQSDDKLKDLIAKQYMGTERAFATKEAVQLFFGKWGSSSLQGVLYLVDPTGNVVMMYDGDIPAKGLLDDMNHLLGVS